MLTTGLFATFRLTGGFFVLDAVLGAAIVSSQLCVRKIHAANPVGIGGGAILQEQAGAAQTAGNRHARDLVKRFVNLTGAIEQVGHAQVDPTDMRIDNTRRPAPAAGVSSYQKASKTAGDAKARSAEDAASVLGIPPSELTPKVQEAIMKLMEEVDKMRQELDDSRSRIEYLEQLADQDSLTPVANRRAFVRELSRNLSYSERYGTPSSVIYLDVNGLKQLNDTRGHAAGDAAILKVAQILANSVRESDVVGRLGGDEFGVMLSHADENSARVKAEFLAKAIHDDPLVWEGEEIRLEVAFGVHTIRSGADAGAALEAADRAMYAHKVGIKKESV